MRRIFGMPAWLAVLAVVTGVVLSAQEQPAPDPSKEIAALKQQIAQLQQPQPTAEQLTKQAQAGYAAIFKEAKEKAAPGCKAAGGRLRVTVGSDGKASVSCEW